LPAKILGDAPVARLEPALTTWKPSERTKSGDTRALGIALRQIEWIRTGAENDPPAPATLRVEVNRPALSAFTRRVGKGQTILPPGLSAKCPTVARVLASALGYALDGQLDGRFATFTNTDPLWFEGGTARIWSAKS